MTRRTRATKRCAWAEDNPLMRAYHDREWGTPVHNDRRLFEFLILEGMQAGLSWDTILRKRGNFRRAFSRFDPKKVARYTARDVRRLMADAGIIRNRMKILAAIANARTLLEVQREFGSFHRYIWGFVDGRPLVNRHRTLAQIPAQTAVSVAMSKDLRRRGFHFVGPTICYAFMQAVGMVNDHTVDCFRRAQLAKLRIAN
ncbi:MAG: DNA-3-methyladenine glycosylase I [Bacillati bacterium ANGP1]|uniref:DNA-3-methyladenine glycosylase I n=1 Tax=Candidatus Segetimicrobium genomatis TaxID=2569760 RepID=A0A537IM72_9BACT|nr:MAG: DNA-3-methyladenine glycosylase I [Terrabacteria group bacterium ANGP1]